jgi:hypothetical protein
MTAPKWFHVETKMSTAGDGGKARLEARKPVPMRLVYFDALQL